LVEFKKYKRLLRHEARLLTHQDYEERQGLIHALEGILKFTSGDYVAKDAKGGGRLGKPLYERERCIGGHT